jgi:PAS domain S-box-containing protein
MNAAALARHLALVPILIGVMALAGWFLAIPPLTGPGQGAPSTMPNTAVCLILAGLGIRLQLAGHRVLAGAAAVPVAVIGLLTLVEYLAGVDLSIDRLLFQAPAEPAQMEFPGRMSRATSVNFMLTGVGLTLAAIGVGGGRIAANLLAAMLLLSAMVSLVGYCYDAQALRTFAPYQSMSLYTTVAFLAVAAALLLAIPEADWALTLVSAQSGGKVARQLLLVVMTAPVLLGLLATEGHQAGWWSPIIALTLFTVGNMALFAVAVLRQSLALDRLDDQRALYAKSLHDSEERYRSMVERIPDVTWSADRSGRLYFMSSQLVEIYGVPSALILSSGRHPYFPAIHPEDVDYVRDAYGLLFGEGGTYDVNYRIRHSDGRWLWVHDRAAAVFERDGVLMADGLMGDVTVSRAVKQVLQEQQEMLAKAQAVAHLGYWYWDIPSGAVTWSDEMYRIFGLRDSDFRPDYEAFLSRVHPEDRDLVHGYVDHSLKSGRPYEVNYRIVLPSGEPRTVLAQAEISLDSGGRVLRMFGTVQDVTEQTRREEDLRASEARFRWLFDCDMIGIGRWHADGSITDANNALLRILGYSREDLRAGRLNWRSMTPPEFEALDQAKFEELQANGVVVPYEKEYFRKDGSRVPVLLGYALNPQQPDQGVYFVLDQTERKRAEEQVRRMSIELALAEEQERKAIARDLHDGLGQVLHIAKVKLERLVAECPASLDGDDLQDLDDLVGDASDLVRSLTAQLSPPVLDSLGLVPALSWLADEMGRIYGLSVTVDVVGPSRRLPSSQESILFRSVRELLINVAKHAGVAEATVVARFGADGLSLTVVDRGLGIRESQSSAPDMSGFGLASIGDRIAFLHGRLDVNPRLEGGTVATLWIPLSALDEPKETAPP